MAAEKVSESLTKLANIADAINQMTSENGEVVVNGREIYYEVRGHFYRWKFIWDSKVVDRQTGTEVNSKNWKSRRGAMEHGLIDLMQALSAKGEL